MSYLDATLAGAARTNPLEADQSPRLSARRRAEYRRRRLARTREDRLWFIDSIQDVCLRQSLLRDLHMTEADLREVQW